MILNVFVNDCKKALCGMKMVFDAAVAAQLNECKVFLRLLGVSNCTSSIRQMRPITKCDVKKCSQAISRELFGRPPDSSVQSRKFSTSASEVAHDCPSKQPLKSSKQRRVPHSRIGRAAGFGNLFLGLGLGAAAEMAKRSVGASDSSSTSNPFLTDANLERIVDTLCRMRGAALKLGQMLSIQDSSLVNPKVQKIFERVRQSADFMPTSQMYSVVNAELGPDWKDKFATFEETPFAAASIGQVHMASLPDGRKVAMKIQYPGVSKSIETDVANITLILKRFDILPRGLFAEEAIRVAKKELKWECDYKREASYAEKFSRLLDKDPVFVVPKIFSELTTERVLTAEYFDGLVLDDCISLPQETRNWIGENILRLCLLEVFVFNTMQTDPNWSNFLYSKDLHKIVLLDFGASREYSRKFVDKYLKVIIAASNHDRPGILDHSRDLGFLTGYETKAFLDAHVEAVSVLGEAFASKEPFDFGAQCTTEQINRIIPVMLEHRLTPPPTETYSLHRKMSGCFLLCSKLGAVVDCRSLFLKIAQNYQFGLEKTPDLF
uniref:ABC1 domain-containing protein n=1 Tax=Mesocestoides corti TaxID=53468 RepID=A0A5K3FFE1_MESCO